MRFPAALLALAATGLLPACDNLIERPASREYIVAAILAPACGKAGCHSSQTNAEGYAFDTLAAANKAFEKLVAPGQRTSRLLTVLRASGESRMPVDGPLPDDDITLIEQWILDGAP